MSGRALPRHRTTAQNNGRANGRGKGQRTLQHVVRDVELTVEAGSFVTLIGHSGCGKSTLLNMAGGPLRADGGAVVLDGAPVTAPGPDRAMVFQQRCGSSVPSRHQSSLRDPQHTHVSDP